jgi:hypothetical protein
MKHCNAWNVAAHQKQFVYLQLGDPRCHRAGINITFRLEQLLQFRAQNGAIIEHPPQIPATAGFLKLLEAEPFAFEELYVATFQVLDREWLASKASCMQFAGVLTDAIEEVLAALVSRPGSIAHFRERLGLGPRARLR